MRHGEHNHVLDVIPLMKLPSNITHTHHASCNIHTLIYDRGKSFDLND